MKFIISFLFIFISLSSNGESITRYPNFTIKLNLSDTICNIKQSVFLYYPTQAADGTETHLLDSCCIDKETHIITLKGYVKEEQEVYVCFTERGPLDLPLLVEPNDHLEANIDITDDFKWAYPKEMITASRHQAEYNQFIEDAQKTSFEDDEELFAKAIDKSDSPALAYLAYIYCAFRSKEVKDRIFQKAYKKFPNYQPFINIKTKPKFPKESEASKRFYKRYKEVNQRRLDILIKRGKK